MFDSAVEVGRDETGVLVSMPTEVWDEYQKTLRFGDYYQYLRGPEVIKLREQLARKKEEARQKELADELEREANRRSGSGGEGVVSEADGVLDE